MDSRAANRRARPNAVRSMFEPLPQAPLRRKRSLSMPIAVAAIRSAIFPPSARKQVPAHDTQESPDPLDPAWDFSGDNGIYEHLLNPNTDNPERTITKNNPKEQPAYSTAALPNDHVQSVLSAPRLELAPRRLQRNHLPFHRRNNSSGSSLQSENQQIPASKQIASTNSLLPAPPVPMARSRSASNTSNPHQLSDSHAHTQSEPMHLPTRTTSISLAHLRSSSDFRSAHAISHDTAQKPFTATRSQTVNDDLEDEESSTETVFATSPPLLPESPSCSLQSDQLDALQPISNRDIPNLFNRLNLGRKSPLQSTINATNSNYASQSNVLVANPRHSREESRDSGYAKSPATNESEHRSQHPNLQYYHPNNDQLLQPSYYYTHHHYESSTDTARSPLATAVPLTYQSNHAS